MSHRHNHLHNCSCRMLTSTSTTVEKKLAANSRHFDHHAFPFREEFFHLVKFKSPQLCLITYIAERVTTYSKSLVNHTSLLDFSPVGLNLVFDMQQQWMGKIPTDKYSGIKNQIFLCRCSFRVRHTRLWSRTSYQQTRPSLTELRHPPKHVSQA